MWNESHREQITSVVVSNAYPNRKSVFCVCECYQKNVCSLNRIAIYLFGLVQSPVKCVEESIDWHPSVSTWTFSQLPFLFLSKSNSLVHTSTGVKVVSFSLLEIIGAYQYDYLLTQFRAKDGDSNHALELGSGTD